MSDPAWPALPFEDWRDTCETLHMWTQMVGKIRLKLSPRLNHWWHVALYVTPRGLTTSAVPYGEGAFEIRFDFLDHRLEIVTSGGGRRALTLEPQPVAEFYRRLVSTLEALGIIVEINTKPQEVPDPVPFEQDYRHASYDRRYAHAFWRILLSTSAVLQEFRGQFIGKSSPVHFFWGSFDLACTRFSGRPAPPRKGVISSEAYSHECSSVGFWPGGGLMPGAAFYSYTVPQPPALPAERVRPDAGFWSRDFSEFILMYDDVRRAASPHDALLDFFQSTYEAGANLAGWDRRALEREWARSAA